MIRALLLIPAALLVHTGDPLLILTAATTLLFA